VAFYYHNDASALVGRIFLINGALVVVLLAFNDQWILTRRVFLVRNISLSVFSATEKFS